MSKINDLYPSKYLKADDIKGREPIVTIRACVVEEMGNDEQGKEKKPVLYFEGKDRGLSLNRTNAETIALLLGSDESDDWIGKRIKLVCEVVTYKGKATHGIRARGVDAPVKAAHVTPQTTGGSTLADQDVPF